jgi:hypothetical protein
MQIEIYSVIWSLLEIGFLLTIWYIGWHDLFRDQYRSEIFTLRESLFQEADAGRIAFDHPAYRMLREMMNGCLRYMQNFTFWHVLIMNLVFRERKEVKASYDMRWKKATKRLSPADRVWLEQYRRSIEKQTFIYMLKTSLFFSLVVTICIIGYLVKYWWKSKHTTRPYYEDCACRRDVREATTLAAAA